MADTNARVAEAPQNSHSDQQGLEMTIGPPSNSNFPAHLEDIDMPEIAGDSEMDDRDSKYPAGNSSARGAIANFVNTIVGAGIVGLPFALAQVCAMSQLICNV